MILQMDEAYEPPTSETRTVYGLHLQVCFCHYPPTLIGGAIESCYGLLEISCCSKLTLTFNVAATSE